MPSARHPNPDENAIDDHINAIILGIIKMYLEGNVSDGSRTWRLAMSKIEMMNSWLGKKVEAENAYTRDE